MQHYTDLSTWHLVHPENLDSIQLTSSEDNNPPRLIGTGCTVCLSDLIMHLLLWSQHFSPRCALSSLGWFGEAAAKQEVAAKLLLASDPSHPECSSSIQTDTPSKMLKRACFNGDLDLISSSFLGLSAIGRSLGFWVPFPLCFVNKSLKTFNCNVYLVVASTTMTPVALKPSRVLTYFSIALERKYASPAMISCDQQSQSKISLTNNRRLQYTRPDFATSAWPWWTLTARAAADTAIRVVATCSHVKTC